MSATVTEPSSGALDAAEAVAHRVSNRAAQVRRRFVVAEGPREVAPMAQVLRGGRGGVVRLKLYLSLLWFAAAPPYDVTYPARAWATLLDLPDPDDRGARRIAEALAWLDSNGFVESQRRPGLPSRIELRDESGTGRPYTVPGATWRDLPAEASSEVRNQQRYLRLEPTFWTSGWLSVLSGPAVAMYLVLRAEARPSNLDGQKIWFSPKIAAERYSLSPDTRTRGLSELTASGLVVASKSAVGSDAFDLRRTRNVYEIRTDRLNDAAVGIRLPRVPARAKAAF